MNRYLLDVNVLVALIDPAHVQHDAAHAWFGGVGQRAFATCLITENGLPRIVGYPKHPNSPGPPSAVAGALAAMRALPGHSFWADSIGLLDNGVADASQLSSHARLTDCNLLTLAAGNKGMLTTLDHKLATDLAAGGPAALALI
jgi:toxin-antitoxin system PIN domain toxin